MNVSLTTKELHAAYHATKELTNIALPVKASYWVTRLTAKLKPDFEPSEKIRTDLIVKHGEVTPSGTPFISGINKEAVAAFSEAWTPIEETVIEIAAAPTINIDTFGSAEIKPSILIALDKFITE